MSWPSGAGRRLLLASGRTAAGASGSRLAPAVPSLAARHDHGHVQDFFSNRRGFGTGILRCCFTVHPPSPSTPRPESFSARTAKPIRPSYGSIISQQRLAYSSGSRWGRDQRYGSGSSQSREREVPLAQLLVITTLKAIGIVYMTYFFAFEVSACGGASMLPVLSVDGDTVLHLRLPFYRAIERFLPDHVVGYEARHLDDRNKTSKSAYFGGPRGKFDPAMGTGLKVGDLIVATSPIDPTRIVCKRIIGLAGDTILVDPRVDPEPWHKNTWHTGQSSQKQIEVGSLDERAKRRIVATSDHFESLGKDAQPQYIVVPKGHVWVGGENMACSRDSRHYGPLPLGLVHGIAIARLYPKPRWLSNTLQPLPQVTASEAATA